MKKFITLFLLAITLVLVGCDQTTTTTMTTQAPTTTEAVNLELFNAIEYLRNAESLTLETTSSSDLTEDITSITHWDETGSSTSYVGIALLEHYTMEIDGVLYMLIKPGSVYVPFEIEDVSEDDPLTILLSGDGYDMTDFILEDDYYVFQTEDEDESFKIKVVDGVINEINFNMREDGILFTTTIRFLEYNNATVEFPDDIVDFETYFNLADELAEYDIMGMFLQVWFINGSITVTCNDMSKTCDYEGPPHFVYHIDEEMFQMDTEAITIDQLYANYPELIIPREDLENMLEMYHLIFD